ncbi:MAG: protein kinase [Candidatus Aminicenantes bacterium]|nr:protein kinase [Candidatus Aminicenantes bacterium]
MIGKTISHYKILEKIGEGGMGVVYKAEDTKLKRIVALKFLPPEFNRDKEAKKRFLNEARSAAAIEHPNICPVYEINEDDDQLFIVMSYMDGQTLMDRINQSPIEIEESLKIVTQIAEGLNAAHKKEIVHRDIKSANIILTNEGVIKILDFGLAKLRGQTKLTKENTTLGTVSYMSPEQTTGGEVNQSSDIWSLGVVFYEMLTGQLPFRGHYEQAVIYSILNEEPEPLSELIPDVPIQFEQIIKKMLARDPLQRYPDLSAFLEDLKKLKKGKELKEITTGHEYKVRLTKKYLALGIFIIAGVIVLLLLFLPGKIDAIRSIAVLPLENLSNNTEQEYFVDGMTEALITELCKISGLRVISRTSVMQFKGVQKSLPEIAKSLNVDAIVVGSVLRIGGKVRITTQLIRVEPEQQLWAEEYVRNLKDVLTVQKDVVRVIVQKIRIRLTPAEEANLMNTSPVNPKAHELYLRGRFFVNKAATLKSIQKGIKYFQKSLEIDDNYALTYSGLADSYAILGVFALLRPYDTFPKAKEFAIKALEIDETLAEVHTQFGYIKMSWDWDWVGAENAFKRAIELNPSYSYTYMLYANYFSAQGRFDKAIETMNKALELDPLSILYTSQLGIYLYLARSYDEAIVQLLKTLEMDPDFTEAIWALGVVYEQKKMHKKAISELQKAIKLSRDMPMYIASLGHTYALSGNRSEALKILDKLLNLSKHQYVSSYNIALIYTGLGEKDQAITWLKRAFEERDGNLASLLKIDPRLDSLCSDPGFISILKKMGLE